MSTDVKMQDLHVHTHLSDGLSSPAEVVRAAAALGIARLAITDHDCLDAHLDPEAIGAARALRIELVAGLELDCTHQGKELEVLGYGFDPEDEALGRRLRQVQTDRRRRFAFLCEGMAARGEPVRPEGVLANATLVPIKVHLYRALAAAGRTFPGGYHEFKDCLATLGPEPLIRKPTLDEAVALIRGAGGRAVLAHPLYFTRHTPVEELVSAAAAAGCEGVELIYPYTFGEKGLAEKETREGLAALREALSHAFPEDCLCTSGSDTHDLAEWPSRLAILYPGSPLPPSGLLFS